MSKLEEALKIRDRIIARLGTEGRFTSTNIGAVMSWGNDEIDVIYRTPFNKLPEAKEQVKYAKALIKQQGGRVSESLEYGLDVWVKGKGKVLNIEWSKTDKQIAVIR
jgi:hypothetical protein